MSLPKLRATTRLRIRELLNELQTVLPRAQDERPAQPLDLIQLEERVLLSASPAAAAAEVIDTALLNADAAAAEPGTVGPTGSPAAESGSASLLDQMLSSQNATSDDEGPIDSRSVDAAADDAPQAVLRELVFLDTGVEDYQQLLDDLWSNDDPTREFEVVLLQNSRDGIEQITEVLAGRTGIDAVHIVSHGTDTAVKLGSTWLTQENLSGYAGEIAAWGNSLTTDADLLFYGCDLAASSDGRLLVDSISALTSADVAASDDDTGHAIFGADWDLEYTAGQIETQVVFSQTAQDNWGHLLNVTVDATSTGTTTGSSATISHTTTSASDRLMLVGISLRPNSGETVSSVTYNSTALSFVGAENGPTGARVEIWSLIAPDSGTHDVVVNFSSGGHGGATVGVMTFTGVDQAAALGTFASDSGDASSGSLAVGSASDELVFGVLSVKDSNLNLVPGAGQTERWDLFTGSEANGGGSTETGAASVDMSWSWSTGTDWSIGGVSIKPSSNLAPVISAPGPSVSYTEGDGVVIIDGSATASDLDSTDLDGGTLTVDFTANGTVSDLLSIRNEGTDAGQIGTSGSTVRYQGTTIGSFAGGTDGSTPLVITFNSNSTPAAAQALMRNITYANVSDVPSTSARTVRFVLTDGDSRTSNAVTETISLTEVNDRPYFGAGGDGSLTTAVPGSTLDFGFGSVVQSDGRIIVAGSSNVSDFDLSLVRYNADGSLDQTFGGGDGIVTLDLGGNEFGFDVAMQTDGKIVVAGQTDIAADVDSLVARFNSDGSLDTTFDGDGYAITNISGDDSFRDVAIQTDGKIVAVGVNGAGGHDFSVARYNANGSLDTGFDTDGVFTLNFGGSSFDQVTTVALQSDGKIVAGGLSSNQFALVRLTTTGALDASFDSDGLVTTDFGAGNETINGLAIQADGKIVAGGTANLNFALARYNTNGSLDTTFDSDGRQTSDLGGTEQAYDIALTSSEKILISGSTNLLGDNDVMVQRYNTDGSTDRSFNTVGTRITVVGVTNEVGYSVNSLADGSVLVGGNTSPNGFLLSRYTEAGPEDTTFGATTNLLNGNPTFTEAGAAVVLDADVQVFDAELSASDSFNGATLTLVRDGGANSDDEFSATGDLSTLTESGKLVLSATTIGTVTTNSSGKLVLTFDGNATQSAVNETLQSVAYANGSDAPSVDALITWSFSDGNTGSQGTGGALSATGSTTVDIAAVNDAPVASITPSAFGVNEDDSYRGLFGFSVSDVDVGTNDLAVTLTVNDGVIRVGDTTGLTFTSGANQTASMTFTGQLTDLNNALASLAYRPDPNFNGTDTVTLTVDDQGNTGGGALTDFDTASITVTADNDAPTITAIADQTPAENTATGAIAFTVGDVETDAGSLVVTATSDDQTLVPDGNITLGGSGASRTINVLPGLNQTGGPATITVTVDDGTTTTQTTFDVTVTAVNDDPLATDLDGDTLNYTEGDGVVVIEQGGDAVVSDVDSTDFDGGTLNLEVDGGLQAGEDVFSVRNQGTGAGQIGVGGSNVSYEGTVIGTVAGGTGVTPLTVTFNANATPAGVTALVRNLTYQNTSEDNPTAGTRSLAIDITDGDGGATQTYNLTINVTATNDVPVADLNGVNGDGIDYPTTFSEGDFPVAITDSDAAISDPDDSTYEGIGINLSGFVDGASEEIRVNGELFQATVSRVTTTVVGATTFDVDFDGSGFTITRDGGGTIPEADLQALLLTVAYENTSQNPTAGNRTFDVIPQDAAGLNASPPAVSTVAVSAVNDAPVATADPGKFESDLLTLNPLSYWRLGETSGTTSIDDGSVENNGTYNGTTPGQAGALANDSDPATRFNGTSDYVEFAHDAVYLLDNGTIQLWFNADAAATGTEQHLFSKDSTNFDTGGHISIYLNTAGRVEVRLQSTTSDYFVQTSSSLSSTAWHHVAVSFGDNGLQLYVDGAIADSDNYTGGLGTTSGGTGNFEPITIGAGSQNSGDLVATPVNEFFGGLIDEVAILGTAVNADTIQDLYAAGLQNYQIVHDSTLNVTAAEGVLANDFDADGDALTATAVTGPSNAASFTLNPNGSFQYTPTAGFSGTDSFTYKANDGSLDSGTVTVTLTVTNDVPVITTNGGGPTAAINVAENSTAVTTVTSTDPDGGLPVYSISGGVDAAKFAINSSSGVLTFVSAPDFETPTDAGTDNVYDLIVQVSDGAGGTDSQTIAVTVTPDNDNTPAITSDGGGASAALNVEENSTAVTTVTATDADLPGDTLTYSISGGADSGKFAINSSTGDLTFVSAPDRESPTDVGTDNVYDVIVQVSDGTLADTQDLAVTVTNVAATFVVTTTDDTVDGTVTSIEALNVDKGADGKISLREAILAANATANGGSPDLIQFEISDALIGEAHTILLSSPLPALTEAVTIDGTTDADFATTPIIVLDGTSAGGGADGLTLSGGNGTTIRGLVFSSFTGSAINVQTGSVHLIAGNFIGTNVTGTSAAANGTGISIADGVTSTTIGGSTTADRNVISGNTGNGIGVNGATTTNITISGNHIGTDVTGTAALANGGNGIALTGGTAENTIGGTTTASANVIAYNGGIGVRVDDATNGGNSVRINSIYDNGGLGIDLGNDGVTANGGADLFQDFAAISAAVTNEVNITLQGSVTVTPSAAYAIDFYFSPAADVSGFGEGRNYIATLSGTADGTGVVNFDETYVAAVTAGSFVTATTTDSTGHTSEFSQSVEVFGTPPNLQLDADNSSGAGNNDFASAYVEDGPSVAIVDSDVSIVDPDSANLSQIVITLTNRLDGVDEQLTVDTSITASFTEPVSELTLTLSGADSRANYLTVLSTIDYSNASDMPDTTDRVLTFVATDSDGNVGSTRTTTLSLAAANDSPVLDLDADDSSGSTGADYTATFTEGGPAVNVTDSTDAALSDSNNGMLESISVVITNLLDGSAELLDADLTGTSILKSYNSMAGTLSLTGTDSVANYRQVLRTVTYSNSAEHPDTTDRSITVTANDAGPMPASNVATSTISIVAVNDAPVNTVPTGQTTDVDTALVFSTGNGNAISVADFEATMLEVTLSSVNGTLALNGTTGLSFSVGTGTDDSTMTFTGSPADINNALDGLTFDPTTSYSGAASLTIDTSDLASSGSGGVLTDADAVSVTVGAGVVTFTEGVNGYSGTEDTEVNAGTPDDDLGAETIITLDVNDAVRGGRAAGLIRFADLFGSGTRQIPFGSTIDSASMTVTVVEPSTNGANIGLYRMLSPWTESSTWNSLSAGVARDDAEAQSTADSTLGSPKFTGPQTFFGLEAALQSWSDGETNDGWAVISDSNNDFDFYSSEHAVTSDRPTLTISFTDPQPSVVTLDADDSSGAGGGNFETTWTEDSSGAVAIVDADALITDVDSTTLTRLEVEFTNFSDGDALNFDLTGTSITSSKSGIGANITYEFNGPDSLASFNQVLQTLEFDNSSETPDDTPRTILIRVIDQVSEVSTDLTSTVNVVATNDAPTVVVPGAQSVNQNDTLTFSAAGGNSIVLGDVDATVLRATVNASNGSVTLGSLTGLSFTNGDGVDDASVEFSGNIADVNAALDGLSFLHGVNHGGAATISVTANDLAASGIGGVMTTTETIGVMVVIPSGPPIAGDSFLQGDFLEIGLGADGVIGSDSAAPAGFFSAGSILGAEVDHDRDGFGVGQVDGDFILPGTPEESWGLSVGGLTTFNGNTVVSGITGSLGNFQDNGTTQSVDFAGSTSGLSINSVHSVTRSDLFMDVEVTLTNSTGSTLSDTYYFRNVDPDNNFDTSGNFLTTNTVLSQGDDGSSAALVTATQADGSYLGLLGFGENARVTHGGFANHDPIAIFNGTGGLSSTGSATADAAVSLAFKVDSINAGESVTLRYRYLFGTPPTPVADLDPSGTGGVGPDFAVTYTENDGAVSIVAADATLVDADSSTLDGLTVRITNLQDGVAESLAADTAGTSITALAYDSGTGTLTLPGSDTIANYRQVLRSVTYENTSETPDTTTRTITFVVTDGENSSEPVTTFVSVISVNDVPTATDGNVTTNEDTLYTFTTADFNYSDLDNDAFAQIQVTSLPTAGSLERLGVAVSVNDLIPAADIAAGRLTYTPDLDDFGTPADSFGFLVHDGSVFSAVSNSMNINVNSVNDDPVITSSTTALVNENDTAVLTATATDVDVPIQSLLFSITGTDASRFNINPTSGELTFAVAPDFEAPVNAHGDNVYEVTVEVSDGAGGIDSQNITVTVTDVDEFDITAISDVDATNESVAENLPIGTAVGIEALATDSDGTDAVMYSLDSTAGGRFQIDPVSGVVTTDAVLDAETATAHTITVRATSTDGSTTTRDFTNGIVDVDEFDTTAVADVDVTADGIDENVAIESTVGVTAFAEDLDVTDSVLFTLDDDAGGLLTIDPLSGIVTVADDIDFETTPNLEVTIRATSTDGSFTTLDVTVPVSDLNDNPPVVTLGQSFNFSEFATNLTVVGTALATDADTVGTLENWAITGGNGDGVFTIDAETGTLSVADNSTVNFEVTSSYALTLIVEDGSNVSVAETVTVNVVDENDVPLLVTNEDITVVEGSSVTVTSTFLEVFDEDELPAEIIYTVSTPPTVGQFELTTGPGTTITSFTQDDIDGGRLVYIHDGSEADDLFTFTVSDGSGGTIDSTDHSITTSRVNDAPANSLPASQSTDEDTPLVFSAENGNLIAVSDDDVFSDSLGVRLTATNGTLTLTGTSGLTFATGFGTRDGQVMFAGSAADINAALEGLQFNPDENYHGPATVRIEVRDFGNSGSGGEKTDDDTVTITVRSINDAPVSFDDEYTVRQFATLTVSAEEGVSANDQDVEADRLSAMVVDEPEHGTLVLNADGSLTYVPDSHFYGQDTFTYLVNDGSANSEVAEVVILVQQTVTGGGDGGSGETDGGDNRDGGDDGDGNETDEGSTDGTGPDGTGVDPVTDETGSKDGFDNDSDDEKLGIDPSTLTVKTDTPNDDEAREDDTIRDAELASSVRRARERLAAQVTPNGMMSAAPLRTLTTGIPELPEDSIVQVLAQAGLWNELDQFEEDVALTSSGKGDFSDLVVGTTSVAGTSLTVGYVIWLLRSGSILVSFVSSLPAWTMMDPLPVLEESLAANGNDDDDDSLQSLLNNHSNES